MGLDILLIRIVSESVSELNWFWEEENPELKAEFSNLLSSRKNNKGQIEKGYYYEEISYQRKGMKPLFYTNFKPDEFILTKTKLLELKNYVLESHLSTFETDFIEKFEEGKNIILMEY